MQERDVGREPCVRPSFLCSPVLLALAVYRSAFGTRRGGKLASSCARIGSYCIGNCKVWPSISGGSSTSKARRVGGDLKQDAARLAEVNRMEVVPVHDRADPVPKRRKLPEPVALLGVIRGPPCDMVDIADRDLAGHGVRCKQCRQSRRVCARRIPGDGPLGSRSPGSQEFRSAARRFAPTLCSGSVTLRMPLMACSAGICPSSQPRRGSDAAGTSSIRIPSGSWNASTVSPNRVSIALSML